MNIYLVIEPAIATAETFATIQSGLDAPLHQLGYMPQWTLPEEIRLLVHDFGEVEQNMLPDLKESVQATAASLTPFSFSIEKIEFYPSEETPRFLFATTATTESSPDGDIWATINKKLSEHSPSFYTPAPKEWRPLMQLGRIKSDNPRAAPPGCSIHIKT